MLCMFWYLQSVHFIYSFIQPVDDDHHHIGLSTGRMDGCMPMMMMMFVWLAAISPERGNEKFSKKMK